MGTVDVITYDGTVTVIPYRAVKKGDSVLALRSTMRMRGIAQGKPWNRRTYMIVRGATWMSDGDAGKAVPMYVRGCSTTVTTMQGRYL